MTALEVINAMIEIIELDNEGKLVRESLHTSSLYLINLVAVDNMSENANILLNSRSALDTLKEVKSQLQMLELLDADT